MLQLCTKNDPSHGSAHQSLGETTKAAAPSRALEGRSVTSLPLVRGGGRGADRAGEGLLPTPMPFLQDVLGFSELCVFARLAAAGLVFPGFCPSARCRHCGDPPSPPPNPARSSSPLSASGLPVALSLRGHTFHPGMGSRNTQTFWPNSEPLGWSGGEVTLSYTAGTGWRTGACRGP